MQASREFTGRDKGVKMQEVIKDCPYFKNAQCTAFEDGMCWKHNCMTKEIKRDKEKKEKITLNIGW